MMMFLESANANAYENDARFQIPLWHPLPTPLPTTTRKQEPVINAGTYNAHISCKLAKVTPDISCEKMLTISFVFDVESRQCIELFECDRQTDLDEVLGAIDKMCKSLCRRQVNVQQVLNFEVMANENDDKLRSATASPRINWPM